MDIDALTCDVFGTLVDWRSGVIAAGAATGVRADWAAVAEAWRREYQPALDRTRARWRDLDDLQRETLPGVLARCGVPPLDAQTREALVQAWHRLPPWPDTVGGLARLRARWTVATLSNGHVDLLTDLVAAAALPVDVVLSAEHAGRYKPDPEVYRTACARLGLEPPRVCMVAAHPDDLAAARAVGLKTAYVRRPLEWGPDAPARPDPPVDVVAADLHDLADRLGCPPLP